MTGHPVDAVIVLDDGHARAEVYPRIGAAIGRYDLVAGDTLVPIFETAASASRTGPFALGMNLLVPFSNRISGGGFTHDRVFHPLERNTPGPFPIHGNAFTAEWTVRETTASSATLTLSSEGPGPFRYDAEVTYALEGGALRATLTVTNRAAASLPFGVGFHPWFPRTPRTTLTLLASGYWTETPDHLPDTHHPTGGDARFEFSGGRDLPDTFFNTALTGWDGEATLTWPEHNLAVRIRASTPLTALILYSPSAASGYVCIEPVSHSVDAHNRSGPGTVPPQILEPGNTLAASTTFAPRDLAPR